MADYTAQSTLGFPDRVVLASGNTNKIREFGALLSGICHVHAQAEFFFEEVHEPGFSFLENALVKARFAAEKTGLPAVGDDSGLMVSALRGAPGIYSGRYAGEGGDDRANMEKLLYVLRGVPRGQRQARYFCAVAFVRHAYDPTPVFATADLHGEILEEPRGVSGYGYDAIFYLPRAECSMGELSEESKLNMGSRALAVKKMLDHFG
ncbi:MAG TPA: RdgB/HAM1 family non-canonical purine NTP pyrophosphatase [Mariprofundaceae bacterium]|nr:RdgB/HAM1 family non-canonical purine NTP pyrophosphatase [Mariprofundaceae bacterium]